MLDKTSSFRICSCYIQYSSLGGNRNSENVGILKGKETRRRDKNQACFASVLSEKAKYSFPVQEPGRLKEEQINPTAIHWHCVAAAVLRVYLPHQRGDEWWHHHRAEPVFRGWEHVRNTAGTTTSHLLSFFCRRLCHSLNKSVGCSSSGSHRRQGARGSCAACREPVSSLGDSILISIVPVVTAGYNLSHQTEKSKPLCTAAQCQCSKSLPTLDILSEHWACPGPPHQVFHRSGCTL